MEDKNQVNLRIIIIFVILIFAVLLLVSYKVIPVEYHKWKLNSLADQYVSPFMIDDFYYYGYDEKQKEWLEEVDKHRNALVELGYFERREFSMEHIPYPSVEIHVLSDELLRAFPDNWCYSAFLSDINYPDVNTDDILKWWYSRNVSDINFPVITIYDTPAHLAKWQEIISAHDSLPVNILTAENETDAANLLSFVGHWISKEGDLLYSIYKNSDNSIKIKSWYYSGNRSVIKNPRLEDKKLIFDEFYYRDHYIEGYPVNPPMGLRYITVLEIDPDDPKVLNVDVSDCSDYFGRYNGSLKRFD